MKESKEMTLAISAKELDKEYGIEKLLEHYVKPGTIVYTVLRSVSSSGMTRHISLVMADSDGTICDITYYAACALNESLHEKNGQRSIRVNGCGMDMGFHLVYNLSSVLFKGDERAGYVLNHRWL